MQRGCWRRGAADLDAHARRDTGHVRLGDASIRFKTSDFGVKPYSAALGLIRNKDEVELVVHVTVKR